MPKVSSEIPDGYKLVCFCSLQDEEVNVGNQNHNNQILSAGSDMDLKPDFYLSNYECSKQGEGKVGPKF